MKFLTMLAIVLGLGLSGFAVEAQAKRFGGGKSLGMKRQAPPAKAPDSPSVAAPAAAGAAGAAAAAPRRSWMGPLAGLAAGLGLAALASHLGFGEGFANLLMIGLAVMAGLALLRFVMRKKTAGAGNTGAGYAMAGGVQGKPVQRSSLHDVAMPAGGSMIGSQIGSAIGGEAPRAIPADFDVAAFERNAKVNFIRLQAAHDAGDLDDIRQFTSPEMFAEIRMDLNDRQGAASTTEVINIQATVIEVAEEAGRYVVSVRFLGSVREDGAPTPEAVDEIWHMSKPISGAGGWVVAGIQQSQ